MSKNLKGRKVFKMPAAQMLLETTFRNSLFSTNDREQTFDINLKTLPSKKFKSDFCVQNCP